ncbi:hypothetical protein FQZ97_624770 [compost metagenome]
MHRYDSMPLKLFMPLICPLLGWPAAFSRPTIAMYVECAEPCVVRHKFVKLVVEESAP